MQLTQPANRSFPRTGKAYGELGAGSGKPQPFSWGKRSVRLGFETLCTGNFVRDSYGETVFPYLLHCMIKSRHPGI